MDIAYRLCPSKIIEKKQEYVLFSLDFLSLYFTLFIVITNIVKDHSFTHFLFWTLLFPVLFLFHLIYRFKTVKKSRHLSFFLLFLAIYVLVEGYLHSFFSRSVVCKSYSCLLCFRIDFLSLRK